MLVLVSATGLGWGLGSWSHADENESLRRRLQALEADQVRSRAAREQSPVGSYRAFSGRRWLRVVGRVSQRRPPGILPLPKPPRASEREISGLERQLAADGHDARWSPETEATTQVAALQPALQASTAPQSSDAHCGRSIYRLVFTLARAGQAADWSDFYPVELVRTLPATQSYQTMLSRRQHRTADVRLLPWCAGRASGDAMMSGVRGAE